MATPPRLLYGYLSASSTPINLMLPWQPSVSDGMFKMNVSDVDAERDNLIFWANTNWGEIPYKFRFGLDARRHLFNPTTQIKQGILTNAKSQLAKYFKHLKIIELKVLTNDDDNTIGENSVLFFLIVETKKGNKIEIKEIIGK